MRRQRWFRWFPSLAAGLAVLGLGFPLAGQAQPRPSDSYYEFGKPCYRGLACPPGTSPPAAPAPGTPRPPLPPGSLGEALRIAGTIEHQEARAEALLAVVKAQAARREFPAAEATLQQMPLPAYQAEAWGELGAVRGAIGERDAAQRAFTTAFRLSQPLTDPQTSARVLTMLARAQGRGHEDDAARQTFARAHTVALQIPGEGWRGSALEAIATGQVEMGDLPAALVTLRAMSGDGSSLVRTLVTIAQAQVAMGNWVRAEPVANQIVGSDHLEERVTLVTSLARARAKDGDREGAVYRLTALLGEVQRATPTRWSALMDLAAAQFEVGDVQGATRLWTRLSQDAAKEGSAGRLCDIAAAQANAGALTQALDTLGRCTPQAEQRSDYAATLVAIARAHAAAGDIETAQRRAQGITHPWVQAEAFMAIGWAQARQGQAAAARDYLARARTLLDTIPDPTQPEKPQRLEAASRLWDMARQTLWLARDQPGVRAVVRETVVPIWTYYIQLLSEMVLTDDQRRGGLEVLLALFHGGSQVGLAREALQAMQTLPEPPRQRVLRWSVPHIASAQAQAGELRQALQAAELITPAYDRGPALAAIVRALTEAQGREEALIHAPAPETEGSPPQPARRTRTQPRAPRDRAPHGALGPK